MTPPSQLDRVDVTRSVVGGWVGGGLNWCESLNRCCIWNSPSVTDAFSRFRQLMRLRCSRAARAGRAETVGHAPSRWSCAKLKALWLLLLQADKRAHHNALERKRRDHIKDSFHSLRDSVPALQGEKVSIAPSTRLCPLKAGRVSVLWLGFCLFSWWERSRPRTHTV